ncbi:hypothetical protein [Actinomadura keratinilytica]|jgi:hypothetical protein|uniref:Chaplin n=1 Tax=Actinomadura keratinilytica TaxID=547461 RepID=A0ABP7YQ56_9ACTN
MTRCARIVLTAAMTAMTVAGPVGTATAAVASGHGGDGGIRCNKVLSDLISVNLPILSPGSPDIC